MKLEDFLQNDPLSKFHLELKRIETKRILSAFLSGYENVSFLNALSRFTYLAPLKYWDEDSVHSALNILEKSIERSKDSICMWSKELGIGFENLLRCPQNGNFEGTFSSLINTDIIRISTEFHPEYFRYAEHIFGNIIKIYWALLKKGSVHGKFELKSAVSILKRNKLDNLIKGFDEKIRNAIAHGEVVFRGFTISYGVKYNYELSSIEIQSKFDDLQRTSNSLVLAVFLFLARNIQISTAKNILNLPPSIITFIAESNLKRPHFKVFGVVESYAPLIGKQLHIGFKTNFKSRDLQILDSIRLSYYLIKNGANEYERFLFEIDLGKEIFSAVIILSKKLELLLKNESTFDNFPQVLDKDQIILYDENKFFTKIKTRRIIFKTSYRLYKDNILENWHNSGIFIGKGRYVIRKVTNLSTHKATRLDIIAVLKYPSDAKDKHILKKIIRDINKKHSKKLTKLKTYDLIRRISYYKFPNYIWIKLYKNDGSIRWLESGGWPKGNLVAVSEKIRGLNKKPIFISKPQEIWKKIRFRFEMDKEEAVKAFEKLKNFIDKYYNTNHDKI